MELKEVFEPITHFLKNFQKKQKDTVASKDKAKERLQLVLMQDRASVSPDFFEMMKKEIIEVIKKYIEIDEDALEVQLTRGFESGDDTGPALYANIPIKNIKPVAKKHVEKEEPLPTIDELSDEEASNVKEAILSDVKDAAEKVQAKIDEASSSSYTKEHDSKVDEITTSSTSKNYESSKENIISEAAKEKIKEAAYEVTNDVKDTVAEVNADAQTSADKIKEKVSKVAKNVSEKVSKATTKAKDSIKKAKEKAQSKKVKDK